MISNKNYCTTTHLTRDKPPFIISNYDKYETIFLLSSKKNNIIEGGLRTKGYFKKGCNCSPKSVIR